MTSRCSQRPAAANGCWTPSGSKQRKARVRTASAPVSPYPRLDQHVTHLEHALSSRIVIEQARGVVATALGTTMDAAFQVLRAQCRSTNRRLPDVCTDITTGRLGSEELSGRGR